MGDGEGRLSVDGVFVRWNCGFDGDGIGEGSGSGQRLSILIVGQWKVRGVGRRAREL